MVKSESLRPWMGWPFESVTMTSTIVSREYIWRVWAARRSNFGGDCGTDFVSDAAPRTVSERIRTDERSASLPGRIAWSSSRRLVVLGAAFAPRDNSRPALASLV